MTEIICKECGFVCSSHQGLINHLRIHKIKYNEYKIKHNIHDITHKCKMCDNQVIAKRTYCSQQCKHSDSELKAKRGIKKNIRITDNTKLLRCKVEECNWITSDLNNFGGHALKHLKEKHNIQDINDYLDYYEIIDKPAVELFHCPIDGCNWVTVDLDNSSGCFTTHLCDVHKLSPKEFCELHPNYKWMWQQYFLKKDRLEFINEDEKNRIQCLECGEWFKKISNRHLKDKHNGMTVQEYKDKWEISKTTSCTTSLKQSKITKIQNKNQMQYYIDNGLSMPWHNSIIYEDRVKLKFEEYKIKYNGLFTINFDYLQYWKGDTFNVTCDKCGKTFNSLTRTLRCYICNPKLKGFSNNELELLSYIQDELGLIVETNNRKILHGKEIDIYIPSLKIGIEYDGLFWHSEQSGKDKNYHLNKTEMCTQLGIQLIHIFEDEWLNKKEIVKQRLLHILGVSTATKIYARKCFIKEIDSKTKNEFLNSFHIQGPDKSSVSLGAYYNNELVSLMTFGTQRVALGTKSASINEYELIRYTSNPNYRIIGIASKLLSHFIKNYNPKKIISYADRRWSVGNLYEKIGFTKVSNGSPNYWYVNDYLIRYHRFGFRKNILSSKLQVFDSELTEWENMQLNGYDRIWDCGSLKYELNLLKD